MIWWFVTHCRVVEDDPSTLPISPSSHPEDSVLAGYEGPTRISVQAFTPILGTLLLSPNGMVGGPARFAVVELLRRVKKEDEKDKERARKGRQRSRSASVGEGEVPVEEEEQLEDDMRLRLRLPPAGTRRAREASVDEREKVEDVGVQTVDVMVSAEDRGRADGVARPDGLAMVVDGLYARSETDDGDDEEEEEETYSPIGLFGQAERRMFEREMLHQVVIGMGRLDMPDEDRKSTRLNSSHSGESRMPSSA